MGLSQKKDIYNSFTKGAKKGLKTVADIVPTLIGLMISVGVLRASGFLELIGDIAFLTKVMNIFLVILMIVATIIKLGKQ